MGLSFSGLPGIFDNTVFGGVPGIGSTVSLTDAVLAQASMINPIAASLQQAAMQAALGQRPGLFGGSFSVLGGIDPLSFGQLGSNMPSLFGLQTPAFFDTPIPQLLGAFPMATPQFSPLMMPMFSPMVAMAPVFNAAGMGGAPAPQAPAVAPVPVQVALPQEPVEVFVPPQVAAFEPRQNERFSPWRFNTNGAGFTPPGWFNNGKAFGRNFDEGDNDGGRGRGDGIGRGRGRGRDRD